jgi:ketosteroid isomerase-like protein
MKKKLLLKIVLVSVILIIIGCKKSVSESIGFGNDTTDDDLTEMKNEVISAGEIFVIALNNGDSIGAANFYSKDAIILRPNNKPIVGRENIRKAFSKRLALGPLRFSMKTTDVWGDENFLVAEEEWILSDKQGKIIDEGKSLEIFKKEDGKWKLHRDCFNSNLPCSPK